MKSFALSNATLLITITTFMVLLTSCSNKTHPVTPVKTFQYSYQEPSRQLANGILAKHLSSGKAGDTIKIKEAGTTSSVRLGANYYSANGSTCRKYTVNPSTEKAACKINNRWYQAKPILIKE